MKNDIAGNYDHIWYRAKKSERSISVNYKQMITIIATYGINKVE